jgi:virginiamycin A acetyltransferase
VITYGRHSTTGVQEECHPDVMIGNFTEIGHETTFWGNVNYPSVSHPNIVCNIAMKYHMGFMTHPDIDSKGPIIVGNDVWIGYGCDILGGVTIGDGAIIGMRTVVSKNVPPYSVVVGHPMTIAHFRFRQETIVKLLQIKWWEWPDELITERQEDLLDVNKFVEKYYVKD